MVDFVTITKEQQKQLDKLWIRFTSEEQLQLCYLSSIGLQHINRYGEAIVYMSSGSLDRLNKYKLQLLKKYAN